MPEFSVMQADPAGGPHLVVIAAVRAGLVRADGRRRLGGAGQRRRGRGQDHGEGDAQQQPDAGRRCALWGHAWGAFTRRLLGRAAMLPTTGTRPAGLTGSFETADGASLNRSHRRSMTFGKVSIRKFWSAVSPQVVLSPYAHRSEFGTAVLKFRTYSKLSGSALVVLIANCVCVNAGKPEKSIAVRASGQAPWPGIAARMGEHMTTPEPGRGSPAGNGGAPLALRCYGGQMTRLWRFTVPAMLLPALGNTCISISLR